MFNLPTELVLNVLSYLPFASLCRLQVVSKSWNEFCTLHESTIYRNAAYLHAYIPRPSTMLSELGSLYSQRALKGVQSWKDLSTSLPSDERLYTIVLIRSQVGGAWKYSAIGKERDHLFSSNTSQLLLRAPLWCIG